MFKFINIRRNTSIRTRFITLATFMLVGSIASCFYVIMSFENFNTEREIDLKLYNGQSVILFKLSTEFKNLYLYEKKFINETEIKEKTEISKKIELKSNELEGLVRDFEINISLRSEINTFNIFFKEFKRYIDINKEICKLSLSTEDELASNLSRIETPIIFNHLNEKLDLLFTEIENKKIQGSKQLENSTINIKNNIYKVFLCVLIFWIFISIVFITDIKIAFSKLLTNLRKFERGKFNLKKIEEFDDEIGQVTTIYNRIYIHLEQLTHFAIEISKGNYGTDFEKLSNEDELGKALLELQKSLKDKHEAEETRKIEDEERNWLNKGLNLFSEISRQNSENPKELSYKVIKNIVKYINANQSCIFLTKRENELENKLELIAAFAYDRRKYLNKSIDFGEGLVGTCAIEKHTIHLKNVPEDYILIGSGLGESKPASLLLVPLRIDQQVLGVIEIASFKEFSPLEISFIEKVAETIAVSISSATANERTEQLLIETKKQTENLSSQEEKTRQQLADIELKQLNVQNTHLETIGFVSAIDTFLIKAEYELNGNLISANSQYLNTVESKLEEIKGQNVKKYVPFEKLDKFNQYWQNLCKGIPYNGIMKHTNKSGKDIWMMMSYYPIKNNIGEIYKILFLASNISKVKKGELEYHEQAEEFKKLLEQTKSNLNITKTKYKQQIEKELELNRDLEQINEKHEIEIEKMHQIWRKQLKEAAKLPIEINNLKSEKQNIEKEHELLKTKFEINIKTISLDSQIEPETDLISNKINNWLENLEKE